MDRLTGKVALVTGATSGIGRAAALALAEAGASVALTGRRADEGERVADEVARRGSPALFVRGDLRREQDAEEVVSAVLDRFGRLDVAFNNAGVGGDGHSVDTVDEVAWQAQIDGNVSSVLWSLKHEVPALRAAGGGVIVNNASVLGTVGLAGAVTYVAAKHAVIGLTRAAALELAGDDIRVNAIAPGATDTPMYRSTLGATAESAAVVTLQHPLGRVGRPQEIASLVTYLAGDDAAFITGAVLAADGGWSAR